MINRPCKVKIQECSTLMSLAG